MASPVVTVPTDLSTGLNTLWITNNGALSPIFVTVDSTTTEVVGGAVPSGASVVVASVPAQTTEAQPQPPWSIMSTVTVLCLRSTPPNVELAVQTVTTLDAIGRVMAYDMTTTGVPAKVPQPVAPAMTGSAIPVSTDRPTSGAPARTPGLGPDNQGTAKLALAIVVPVVGAVLLALLICGIIKVTPRIKKSLRRRKTATEDAERDQATERKRWSQVSLDLPVSLQELEAPRKIWR
ncbi:hypothetical protein LTR56_025304 [Elasticomyces elasticus]|nr:hypothetical protein LTR22_027446 [Elasticomyces elasticus]KAK3617434.1 hypothetical protein LTR56_025304 [Elasticomyces elasticus]KAK4907862.1 hypothetical protein LTR49_023136 [Elasticomyces elasticus]KAK5740866.1 hypothetical protein LTS12_024782 [Elasticomyces elasticus]